jgi:hypothetical protein
MIEKPVAYYIASLDGKLVAVTTSSERANEMFSKSENSALQNLFTESQLKAERENAIRECAKIAKYWDDVEGNCAGEIERQILTLLDN